MTNTIDLHTHSTASDGLYSPTELLRLAHDVGLKTIGLVDHDTTGGVVEAQAAGEALGVEVVPGIEVNTDLPNKRGEAHMLGYFVEYERAEFQRKLQTLREARELTSSGVEPLYEGFVELLLARAEEEDDEARQMLLREARNALEDLKASELRDYFRDECVADLESQAVDIDEVVASMTGSKRASAVYPISLPDRLELLVSLPRAGLQRYTVEVAQPRDVLGGREGCDRGEHGRHLGRDAQGLLETPHPLECPHESRHGGVLRWQ